MIDMGKTISLSGIDGSGKTTQVAMLKDYLEKKNVSYYETEKMFGYFLLKPFISVLRKRTNSPKSGPVTRNKELLYKLWFIPAFFDIWANYLIKVEELKDKYDVVIADRFFTDIWANLQYYGYAPGWSYRQLLKFLPNSDIPFLFEVKPHNVRKREDDFPLSYYKEQSILYKQLGKLRKHHIIDANGSAKNSFRQIKNVLEKYGI